MIFALLHVVLYFAPTGIKVSSSQVLLILIYWALVRSGCPISPRSAHAMPTETVGKTQRATCHMATQLRSLCEGFGETTPKQRCSAKTLRNPNTSYHQPHTNYEAWWWRGDFDLFWGTGPGHFAVLESIMNSWSCIPKCSRVKCEHICLTAKSWLKLGHVTGW